MTNTLPRQLRDAAQAKADVHRVMARLDYRHPSYDSLCDLANGYEQQEHALRVQMEKAS